MHGYPVQFPSSVVDDAREGEPLREFLGQQRQHDLAVIGTHGRGALARTRVSSIASDLQRRAETPVLVLRKAEGI